MAATIANQALLDILDDASADADELNGTLHLYQNDYTPLTSSVAGDFTECTFSGYAAYDFAAGGQNWPSAGLDGSNNAQSVHTDVEFEHNGGATANDVYGYYMLDGGGDFICGERYAGAPFNINAVGQKFTVSPTVKLKR